MSDTLQFELHPDADQLTAFSEGLLPEPERLATMAHLADCASCREVVFLAQEAVSEAVVAPSREPAPSDWRRWFSPLAVFGASAALVTGGVLIAVTLHTSKSTPAPVQTAQSHTPELPPPPPPPALPAPAPAQPARPMSNAGVVAHAAPRVIALPPAVRMGAGAASGVVGGIAGGTGSAPAASTAPAGPVEAASTMRLRTVPPGGPPQTVQPLTAGIAKNDASVDPNTSDVSYRGAMAPAGPALQAQGRAAAPVFTAKAAFNGAGRIAGIVRDQTGAVIPGARVDARNLTTAALQTVTTDAHGSFAFAALPSGQYDVSVTAPAFQTFVQQVTVQPQQLAQLTPTLAVGQESETVEVNAATAALNTQPATVGTVILPQQVESLPIDGNNVIALAALVPGVTNVATPLPSKLPAVTLASRGKVLLALDTGGTLFRSTNGGKQWKPVKQQWQGKATSLDELPQAVSSQDAITTAAAPPSSEQQLQKQVIGPTAFQLITSTGLKWTSVDGQHWKASQK